MQQPFSIQPAQQMGVPESTVGLFEWRLTGASGVATGRVMASGVSPGNDALQAGIRPATEYWFLDASRAATGPATRFEVKVVRVSTWNRTDFPDVSKAAAIARVFEEPRDLQANEVPTAGVVASRTPPGPSGRGGFAAIVFEIPASGDLRAPSWFWTPDAQPHLFGTLVEGNGSVSITMKAPASRSAAEYPRAGWKYVPGQ